MELTVKILSLLPLKALYVLSDCILYPIIYHIVRYRRKIVRLNLTNAFPTYAKKQIKSIEKGYYHHLSDVIMEIIWSYRATVEDLEKHYIITNIEDCEKWVHEKGGVVFMLGHICNWEWLPEVQKRFKDPAIQHYNVYRRQKNATADRLLVELRDKRSGKGSCIEKNTLLRRMVALKQSGQLYTLGLVSDQKVQPQNAYHSTLFLNQKTTFLGGGEILSKKFDKAVTYLYIEKLKRGTYRMTFDLITLDPQNTDKGEITEQFARRLESNILADPTQWLWSHNRWKFDNNRPSPDKQ